MPDRRESTLRPNAAIELADVAARAAESSSAGPFRTGGDRLGPRRPAPASAARRSAAGSHRVSSDHATASTDTSGCVIGPGPAEASSGPTAPPSLLQTPGQLVQHRVQPQSLDVLHYVVVQAIFLADTEDRHDVGVLQSRRRPRLPLEPLPLPSGRGASVGAGPSSCHVPAQRDLFGLVNDPHAAAADLPQDAVIAQTLGVLEAPPARQ